MRRLRRAVSLRSHPSSGSSSEVLLTEMQDGAGAAAESRISKPGARFDLSRERQGRFLPAMRREISSDARRKSLLLDAVLRRPHQNSRKPEGCPRRSSIPPTGQVANDAGRAVHECRDLRARRLDLPDLHGAGRPSDRAPASYERQPRSSGRSGERRRAYQRKRPVLALDLQLSQRAPLNRPL